MRKDNSIGSNPQVSPPLKYSVDAEQQPEQVSVIVGVDPQVPRGGSKSSMQPISTMNVTNVNDTNTIPGVDTFIDDLKNLQQKKEPEILLKINEIASFKKIDNIKDFVLQNKMLILSVTLLAISVAGIIAALIVAPPFVIIPIALMVVSAFGVVGSKSKLTLNIKTDENTVAEYHNQNDLNFNVLKKTVYEVMRELFKDIGNEQMNWKQYNELFKQANNLIDDKKNKELIGEFALLVINEAKELENQVDRGEWIKNYIVVTAKQTELITTMFYKIIKSTSEDEATQKKISDQLLVFFDNPEKFSNILAMKTFETHFNDPKFNNGREELFKHTMTGMRQGVEKCKLKFSQL